MSIIEWFFIGLIILFFMIVMLISWRDLMKDLFFYREKKKNVKSLEHHKRNKVKSR